MICDLINEAQSEAMALQQLQALSSEEWKQINRVKEGYSSPMHLALEKRYVNVGQLLLINGASIDAVNDEGLTPLMIACDKGLNEWIRLLLEPYAHQPDRLILLLITQQQKPIDTYYSVVSGKGQKDTALMLAVRNGHLEAVKLLSHYMSLLSMRGRIEILKIMNKNRKTALMIAASKGLLEIFKVLTHLIKGASEEEQALLLSSVSNMTSLILAVDHGQPQIAGHVLDILRNTPIDKKVTYLNQSDVNGNTALILAMVHRRAEMIRLIIQSIEQGSEAEKLAVLNKANNHKETALFVAVKLGWLEPSGESATSITRSIDGASQR